MTTVPPRLANVWTVAAMLVVAVTASRSVAAQGTGTISIVVRSAVTRSPVPDATVRALPAARSCVTDADGRCRLIVGAGQVELRVTALGFAPVSRALRSTDPMQSDVTIELRPSATPLDPVVTIGTRGAERTVSSSPVPVDVLSSQLLESTGVDETWQQLQRLVPSVNVPHIPIADNHARPVTLRGLAPHHVLVLVNGKRRHPASVLLAGPSVASTAFTDLAAIPESAIERIEVLRDGAAAQYGSDAIGGVVNIILKSGARHDVQTTFATVASSEGGRHFTDGEEVSATGTFGLTATTGGYLTVSGELRDQHGTNRAYPDLRPQYFAGDPRNDAAPRVSSYEGDGALRSAIAFLNAAAPLGRGVELYAFGGAADREGTSPDAFFRRPLDPRTVRALYPDGFLPVIGTGTGDLSMLAGVRGVSRGWRWDVSSGWGRNRVAYSVRNSNNVSLGAVSPTRFYAGQVAADQWTSNADVSRELRVGTMPVTVAGGLEFRDEGYRRRSR